MPGERRIGVDPTEGGLSQVSRIIQAPQVTRGRRVALLGGTGIEAARAREITVKFGIEPAGKKHRCSASGVGNGLAGRGRAMRDRGGHNRAEHDRAGRDLHEVGVGWA